MRFGRGWSSSSVYAISTGGSENYRDKPIAKDIMTIHDLSASLLPLAVGQLSDFNCRLQVDPTFPIPHGTDVQTASW